MLHRCLQQGLYAILLFTPAYLFSQTPQSDSSRVEIIHADILRISEDGEGRITTLSGAVQLRQKGMLMQCDSARMIQSSNMVFAFGRVQINRESLIIRSQQLIYAGNDQFARLSGGVSLIRDNMKLNTPSLDYDMRTGISTYQAGGKVTRETTQIISRKGTYNENTELVFFTDSVRVNDPEYIMSSDTLRYDRTLEQFTFFPGTEILSSGNRIECHSGTYQVRNNQATFGKGTTMHNPPQILHADSLFYDQKKGIAIMHDRFHWKDSGMQAEILAFKGRYEEKKRVIIAANDPLLITRTDPDTLWLTADTLLSCQVSETDSTRLFYAWHKVRMFNKNFQGVCDSLSYSFADSTFHFFIQPVMWTEGIQIYGDTLSLRTKRNQPDYMFARKQSWIISDSDTSLALYDQIKGVSTHGYFDQNELKKVHVVQNAESLYFGKTEKGVYEGANKSKCAEIWIYFADKKISKISFVKKPEAVYTPIRKLARSEYTLEGFRVESSRRPISPQDIAPVWLKSVSKQ